MADEQAEVAATFQRLTFTGLLNYLRNSSLLKPYANQLRSLQLSWCCIPVSSTGHDDLDVERGPATARQKLS